MDKKETAEWATCRPGLCDIYIGIFFVATKVLQTAASAGQMVEPW